MSIKNKIKIVHVIGGLNFGGVESVLLNYFCNLDLENYELTIISHEKANEKCKRQFEELGIEIHEVPSKKENFRENIKQIYNIIKEKKPDIVHSHLTLSNYAPLGIACFCKVKVRISHSHLVYTTKNTMQKIYAFLSNMFATHYMACSKLAAVYLFGKRRYKKRKVHILNNAVDISKFEYKEEVRKKIREELKLKNQLIIGHIGRFHEQKNHEFLISVFKEVHKSNENSVLLLIGNGELKDKVKNKIKQENLEQSVIILSAIENIYEYYQAMDIFVLPSLYEGLGVVLIEAQIAGLPCFASSNITDEAKITPLLEFLDINNIYEWKDKIALCKKNEDRLKYKEEIEKAGYNIKIEAKKLAEFYEKIIK